MDANTVCNYSPSITSETFIPLVFEIKAVENEEVVNGCNPLHSHFAVDRQN